ncbi:MAG: hypothetical protein NTY38_16050 [Acidobacteria bacterium]|nr:hypothetical protein [Acidobacteriota bacterium]
MSLTGNARVTEIKASRKQDTSYEWAGEVLSAIHTTVRQPGEQDFNIHFDYDKERKAVRRVSNQPFTDSAAALGAPRLTAAGPVGAGTGVYVVLRNHPQVDPLMVERITGKQVATLVSGNPYFHPFAWEGIFVFRAEYDDQGRVSIARQILTAEQKGQPARVLEFRWEGPLLMEVTERGAEGYHRAMQYSGSKITGEVITYRGKNSKIEYKYRGDRLMEANCDADPSLDSRSRQVLFR